jgi:hypothetical protein
MDIRYYRVRRIHTYRDGGARIRAGREHGMLFRDKIIDSLGGIRVNRINLGLDVPEDLMLWVCTIRKLENFSESRDFGTRVRQFHSWTGDEAYNMMS